MMQDKYTEWIVAYLDDELGEAERTSFEEHLEGCASCREQLEGLSKTAQLVDALPTASPSAQFEQSSLERFDEELFRPSASSGRKLGWLTGPRLAALVGSGIAAAVIGVLVFSGWPTGKPHGEERAIADDLELYADYEVIVNLDLLQAIDTMELEGIDLVAPQAEVEVN